MDLRINSLKKIDRVFGRLACLVAKASVKPRKHPDFIPKASSEKIQILVIRPGGIGDAALLYPALRVLREFFKNAEIDLLAEKRNAGILMGCPYVDRVFLYDFRPPIDLFKAVRTNYDIVIDTEQWHRLSAVFSYLTKAPIRVGFSTNERGGLFSHPVSYSHDDYEVKSFFNLVSAITGEKYGFDENEPFINLDSGLISKMEPRVMGFRKSRRALIGVFPGATIPERRWGIVNFAQVSERLSREGIGTVVVGGSSEVKDSETFEAIAGKDNVLNLAGKTSLLETAATISRLDLFLSGDTGIMHIAYGVGTPTVSLFGAGIQKKWAPIGSHHVVINKNLFCSPCTRFGYTPKCPYEIKCLSDITISDVKDTALRLLSQLGK